MPIMNTKQWCRNNVPIMNGHPMAPKQANDHPSSIQSIQAWRPNNMPHRCPIKVPKSTAG
jgi:hypothetical protein